MSGMTKTKCTIDARVLISSSVCLAQSNGHVRRAATEASNASCSMTCGQGQIDAARFKNVIIERF